ncbi:MAG: bifunctional phosphoserine phosphatase/homoserine phosphotransferase ThrH [Opitutales bacterium]
MTIYTLDLEGVLIPEIWIAFADAVGIEALKRTTRDEPDYDKLMRYRLDILDANNLKLSDVQKVIDTLEPLEGAKEFLYWLKSKGRVVILSDTFEEFAAPLMKKLDYPTLFCHSLEVDESGKITDYKLRTSDQKRKAVEAFRALNFEVVASGDSYNDLSMLRAANKAIMYQPSDKFAKENADLPIARNYTDLKNYIESI